MRARSLTLVLLLAACGQQQTASTLRIGCIPWPGYMTLVLATEQGFFAKEGIEAQIVEYSSLHDLRRGFELGQIDFLPSTMIEVMEVLSQGTRHPEVFFVVDASRGADVVQARPGVDSPAQLRGKRIAYEADSLGVYILARMLDQAGLRLDEVQAIGMDQAEMVTAMAEGRVEAAITYPPTAMTIAAQPGVHTVFSTADIPGEVVDTFAVEQQLLDQNPTLLPRLYRALAAALAFSADQPAAAQSIMAKAMGIPARQWQEAITGIEFYTLADQADWIWHQDRLRPIAERLRQVLGTMTGAHGPLPPHLTSSHRPMPEGLPAAAPR